jgi:putative ABC transport system permease protein
MSSGVTQPRLKRNPFRTLTLIVIDAAASLLRRPGHTLGMISGIMLGVAGATAAVVIADTQQAQIDLRFDLQRSDHVVVKSEAPTAEGFPSRQVGLVRELQPVSSAGEFSIWSDGEDVSRSFASGDPVSVPVLVADVGGLEASGTSIASGAAPSLLALRGAPRIAWVGQGLAHDLGVSPASGSGSADSQIIVRGIVFSVAGIVRNDGGFGYASRAVLMSRPTALAALGGVGTNVRLVAHVRPGSAKAVANYALRSVDLDDSLALTDVTPPDGKILLDSVASDLRRIGAALGLFMGAVGMITIANTLLMSVYQRQRELGLRSAIGWSRRRIGLLVLTESGVAGLTAGLLGTALGLLAAAIWCWAHNWALIMPTLLPLGLIVGGMLASLIGGLLPALRAASVSPLTAMRS